MDYDEISQSYTLKNSNSIQSDMRRCTNCILKYKGNRKGDYHPTLKSVYERQGAKGFFVKIGLYCPNCKKFYKLDQ